MENVKHFLTLRQSHGAHSGKTKTSQILLELFSVPLFKVSWNPANFFSLFCNSMSFHMSVVKNSVSKVLFSFLIHFHDYWITFYNLTFWRLNFFYPRVNLSNKICVSQKKSKFQIYVTDIDLKRSSNCLPQSLSTYINKSMFFGSKMSQTKQKPLRTRGFSKFSARYCSLHFAYFCWKWKQGIEYYFVNQILKFLSF